MHEIEVFESQWYVIFDAMTIQVRPNPTTTKGSSSWESQSRSNNVTDRRRRRCNRKMTYTLERCNWNECGKLSWSPHSKSTPRLHWSSYGHHVSSQAPTPHFAVTLCPFTLFLKIFINGSSRVPCCANNRWWGQGKHVLRDKNHLCVWVVGKCSEFMTMTVMVINEHSFNFDNLM